MQITCATVLCKSNANEIRGNCAREFLSKYLQIVGRCFVAFHAKKLRTSPKIPDSEIRNSEFSM